MFNVVKKTFAYGAHQVTIETGEVARQAGGASSFPWKKPWFWSPLWPPRMPSRVRISSR
jgi:hypothetical protein